MIRLKAMIGSFKKSLNEVCRRMTDERQAEGKALVDLANLEQEKLSKITMDTAIKLEEFTSVSKDYWLSFNKR